MLPNNTDGKALLKVLGAGTHAVRLEHALSAVDVEATLCGFSSLLSDLATREARGIIDRVGHQAGLTAVTAKARQSISALVDVTEQILASIEEHRDFSVLEYHPDMAKASSRRGGSPPKEPLVDLNPAAALTRLRSRYADVEKLSPEVPDDFRFDNVERDIESDIREIFGEASTEYVHNSGHQIFHSDEPSYLGLEADDPYELRRRQNGRKEGLKRTKVLLESLISRVEERIAEQSANASAAAVRDASAAFAQLTIHPKVLVACQNQFEDGHYREAILNAGIALVDYVKERAGNPVDKNGKPLDGTPLMQQVFSPSAPLLKVNDLKTPTDQDEQQGMMFLFAGATLGLRNPRAHALNPDTAEYAVEAIAFLSFLAKQVQAAKR